MSYELIETIEVGSGGAASIEFTSIPQDGVDLLVVLSARNTGGDIYTLLSLNGSTSNFGYVYLYGTGSAVSSFGESGTTAARRIGMMAPSTWTASTFSNDSFFISNYAGSTNKSISSETVVEQDATTGYQRLTATTWSDTSAITSVTLTPSGNSYAQYSTASLYKIY